MKKAPVSRSQFIKRQHLDELPVALPPYLARYPSGDKDGSWDDDKNNYPYGRENDDPYGYREHTVQPPTLYTYHLRPLLIPFKNLIDFEHATAAKNLAVSEPFNVTMAIVETTFVVPALFTMTSIRPLTMILAASSATADELLCRPELVEIFHFVPP